jgi:hypothetical protein
VDFAVRVDTLKEVDLLPVAAAADTSIHHQTVTVRARHRDLRLIERGVGNIALDLNPPTDRVIEVPGPVTDQIVFHLDFIITETAEKVLRPGERILQAQEDFRRQKRQPRP